jgi:hypothetical protein
MAKKLRFYSQHHYTVNSKNLKKKFDSRTQIIMFVHLFSCRSTCLTPRVSFSDTEVQVWQKGWLDISPTSDTSVIIEVKGRYKNGMEDSVVKILKVTIPKNCLSVRIYLKVNKNLLKSRIKNI